MRSSNPRARGSLRRLTLFAAVAAVALGLALASHSNTASASIASGPASSQLNGLKISGNQFVDNSGNPVTLHGVFYTAFEWSCDHGGLLVSEPITTSAIQGLLSWHINMVRLGVSEDCWLGINGARSGGTASQYQQ